MVRVVKSDADSTSRLFSMQRQAQQPYLSRVLRQPAPANKQMRFKKITLIQAQTSSLGQRTCRPPIPSMRRHDRLLQLLGFTSVARRQRHSSAGPACGDNLE